MFRPRNRDLETLRFSVLGRGIAVHCLDDVSRALLAKAYRQLSGGPPTIDLSYTIGRSGESFLITRDGREPFVAGNRCEFLALFDEDLTIELQKIRRELYFVHAAVIEFERKAFMLVGKSGSGKSTTTWALLHHGFGYLSDEVGPVDLETLEVHPFPRALSLKTVPPAPYSLAEKRSDNCGSYYVPPDNFPAGPGNRPVLLAALFFLRYHPESSAPSIRRISGAEGAARLYSNALNPLAHPEYGLDGAIRIASKRPCFELLTADLTRTCALIKDTIEEVLESPCMRLIHDPIRSRSTFTSLHTSNQSTQQVRG